MLRSEQRLRKIRRVLSARRADLTVVLENIHDPHNVSAILRSCDAVGVLRVELLYTIERFPRFGKKSSSSASKWLEHRKHRSVETCYGELRNEGFRILATRMDEHTGLIFDQDLTRPTAFVFGNEHRGVSDEAARMADACIRIPMVGMIASLNVSVAAAVCLYEAFRQRGSVPALPPGLSPESLETLFQEWTRR
jgi:tRNA (guanosine-2'-O-)-methyltransferase